MSVKNDIENESKVIADLLTAARDGQWDHVWGILGTPDAPRKSYLINVIPENRRWGVIHQAVYWRNHNVMRKILGFKTCDRKAKTKACTSECGDTSRQTPLEVAVSYGYTDIKSIIRKNGKDLNDTPVQTFQLYESYNEQWALGLLSVTLAAYKNSFHPSPIDKTKNMVSILADVWTSMHQSEERWQTIRDIVADSVYIVCEDNSDRIKASKSLHDFFLSIIQTYTEEENYMYTFLSMALRRQCHTNYSGDDLALGPYAVVYQMLLLFWKKVPRENRQTFRKMMLTQQDCDKYQVGTKFVWPSVISSSTNLQSAVPFPTCGASGDRSVIFTIDNSTPSCWKPRNIEKYATYMEHERTYPAGARFVVTGRTQKNEDIHVALRLLVK
ncbi:hypothetical protein MAR_028697 [Mya arenaria]|uniref:Mono(ADP-ribosyl)transferase n=1 Tax=Mya arenaria TaxID=6604 RepID=A0ABY7DED0_MYAAR|nr:uncharacterized protein LOC128221066 [Mya arenaria]WAQ96007.1 hypothetical protein MAR_028697 [Mya arenaria]